MQTLLQKIDYFLLTVFVYGGAKKSLLRKEKKSKRDEQTSQN